MRERSEREILTGDFRPRADQGEVDRGERSPAEVLGKNFGRRREGRDGEEESVVWGGREEGWAEEVERLEVGDCEVVDCAEEEGGGVWEFG